MKLKCERRVLVLIVLTLSYMVGEMAHFLIAITSKQIANSIGFGNQACYYKSSLHNISHLINPHQLNLLSENLHEEVPQPVHEVGEEEKHEETTLKNLFQVCSAVKDEERCEELWFCRWEFSGHGMEYQILVGPAYIVVFTISSVIMGFISDRVSRPQLLGMCVIIYSTCSTLTGIANKFYILLLLRVGVAIGVAGCRPASGSLIAEMFDAKNRALANAVFSWGLYFGYSLSFILGIYVTEANILGLCWRSAYVISGILGVPIAGILFMIEEPRSRVSQQQQQNLPGTQRKLSYASIKKIITTTARKLSHPGTSTNSKPAVRKLSFSAVEPESSSSSCSRKPNQTKPKQRKVSVNSGKTEISDKTSQRKPSVADLEKCEEKSETKNYSSQMKATLTDPTLILLFITASVRHTAGYAWAHNNVNYFNQYHQGKEIGYWFTACCILGGSVGVFTGGYISDSIVEKMGLKSRLWLLSTCTVIAVPFSVLTLYLDPPYAFVTLLGYYFFAETWFSLLFTVLVEIVPASIRSMCIGIFLFLMNNIGGNLPMLVEPMAELVGLQTALYIAWPSCLVTSGVMFFISSLFMINRKV